MPPPQAALLLLLLLLVLTFAAGDEERCVAGPRPALFLRWPQAQAPLHVAHRKDGPSVRVSNYLRHTPAVSLRL